MYLAWAYDKYAFRRSKSRPGPILNVCVIRDRKLYSIIFFLLMMLILYMSPAFTPKIVLSRDVMAKLTTCSFGARTGF